MQKIFYTLPGTGKEIAVLIDHAEVWIDRILIPVLFGCSTQDLDRTAIEEATTETWRSTRHAQLLAVDDGKGGTGLREHFSREFVLSLGFRMHHQAALAFYRWAGDALRRLAPPAEMSAEGHLKAAPTTLDVAALIESYLPCFLLLNQYDGHRLPITGESSPIRNELSHPEAHSAISALKDRLTGLNEATALFGHEKDESFQGTLQSIAQTYGGQYLHPGIGEQAAHLLYSVIKNHSFSDGNKRIGAFLFSWFLEINQYRRRPDGRPKLDALALTVLALLVAQSRPDDREDILKLIQCLLS
ncbi:MAG: Fic family protein [Saprospiraceae bacterium]|nr:Fic family protein [Saprospiraceae bacterium]